MMQNENSHQAESTHEEPFTEQQAFEDLQRSAAELNQLWQEFTLLKTSAQQWSKSTFELFLLELSNSTSGLKRILLCHLMFVCLFILFVFSACVGMGLVTYQLSASLLAGYGVFLLSLALSLIGLICWQQYLRRFLGFRQTQTQIKEAMDVCISKATQSHH
ncbi:hypothetical protein [Marinomonas sp.]